jgi:hypothetical protein
MGVAIEGIEELGETRRRRGAGGEERTGREGEDKKEWLGGEE